MAEFEYKALDSSGKLVAESTSGEDRYEVLKRLKGEGYTVLDLKETGTEEESGKAHFFQAVKSGWVRVKEKDLMMFTRQLADLTDAGIPILESLASIRENISSERFAGVLKVVESDIRKGTSFSDALAKQGEVFDDVFVGMIRAGETSGRLGDVIGGLAEYQERDQAIRSQIKGALSYPMITLAFSFLLCYALVAYLLPGFAPIWQQSGLNLHNYPVTEALMKMSALTHNIFDELLVGGLLLGLFLFYRHLVSSGSGRLKKDSFVLRLPVIGSFVRMGVLARVANTMGTLSASGINMVKSLEIAADTAGNESVKVKLQEVSKRVQEGSSLTEAFKSTEAFPKMMIQMIGIGEKSGNIDDMLPRLARYYDRQLQDSMKTMTSMLEPATMIVIGGIVFTFVLGVFLPIIGIVRALQSQM